jgi:two-component system response regulator FixJ
VVDDDEAVRESLQALLESHGYVVEIFGSAEEFLAHDPFARGDCAILDLRMPGMDGLTLLGRLKANSAQFPVIMVSGHGDVPLAVQAMKAGAADFIEKPYSNEAILNLIRLAIRREAHGDAAGQEKAGAAARIASLTAREREVLERLVIGHPNKIIAYQLGISPRTVEIHRANLVKKMQAESLSHLVRLALAAGVNPSKP